MNRLITSDIALNNGQPITDKTIPFIEDGYQEAISNVAKALMRSSYVSTDVVILWGVVFTVSGNSMTYTSGAVYYNGEVYSVIGASITKTTPQTFVFTNTPNFTNGIDPIYAEGNNQISVHQVRQVQLIGGNAGGSGTTNYIGDYLNSYVYNSIIKTNIGGGLFLRQEGNRICITGNVSSVASGGLITTFNHLPLGIDRFGSSGEFVLGTGYSSASPNINIIQFTYNGTSGGMDSYSVSTTASTGSQAYLDCSFSIKTQ